MNSQDKTMPKPVCHPFVAARSALVTTAVMMALAVAPAGTAWSRNITDSAPATADSAGVGGAHGALPNPDPGAGASVGGAVQTYADLVDLAQISPVVVRAVIHRQIRLKPQESPGLAPGFVRLYIEADTTALLVGPDLGESLRFLTDVPLDAAGKVPKLAKMQVLLFGNIVPGKPGDLQLTASDTMFRWSAAFEDRVRAILTALIAPDAPPRITGLREAVHVPGNLLGEGETQLFFATDSGKPVSISVLRRPGEPTRWGVSFGEIVDQSAEPPKPETLAWYRLACFLRPGIPERAAISDTAADKRIAAEDYALVRRELGPCLRTRAQP